MKTITFDPALWRLVPVEPTPEMLAQAVKTPGMKAIDDACINWQTRGPAYRLPSSAFEDGSPLTQAYRAMLAAAPEAEAPAAAEVAIDPQSLRGLVEGAGGTFCTGGGAAFTSVALARFLVESHIVLTLQKEKGFPRLYRAINNLLCHIGIEGQIDAKHGFVHEASEALAEIDGGTYKTHIATQVDPQQERDRKDAGRWVLFAEQKPADQQRIWTCAHEWDDESKPLIVNRGVYSESYEYVLNDDQVLDEGTLYCKWWMPRHEPLPPKPPIDAAMADSAEAKG